MSLAAVLAAIDAYPREDPDAASFADVFVDCVRYNDLDDIHALLAHILRSPLDDQCAALRPLLEAFVLRLRPVCAALDEYYAAFSRTLADYDAAHPPPPLANDSNPAEPSPAANNDDSPPPPRDLAPEASPPTVDVPEIPAALRPLLRHVLLLPCSAGYSAVHAAAANGHVALLRTVLLPALNLPLDWASLSAVDDAASPLHWACLNGQLEVVKLLVRDYSADPAALTRDGHSCLGLAEMAGKQRVANWIIANCDIGLDDDSAVAGAMDA
ncbi:hypothetical protein HDU82_001555, partial [Entophlyctis luteolus]